MHNFVFNVKLPILEPPAHGHISQIRPNFKVCQSNEGYEGALETLRFLEGVRSTLRLPESAVRRVGIFPPVIWSADRVAEWGVMAGGAIIVTQRERASQYNGRFTFFTFVAIMAGATTGLVESQGPHLPAHWACCQEVLNVLISWIIRNPPDH